MSTFEMVVTIVLVVYSISLHELAHAWVATWCGDPTPGRHGRLTWNPIVQLHWLYSVVLPAASYLLGNWPIGFAFTPVDPSRFRKPLRDGALTGAAGPLTNILIALIFLGLLWIPNLADPPKPNCRIFFWVAYWNLFLAGFNLLPIPGLDGYDIVRPALPLHLRSKVDQVRRMAFIPLLLIFILGPRLIPSLWGPVLDTFVQLVPMEAFHYVKAGLG